ncbi:MAG TPA: hypothetical protein VFR80_16280 [Pyrinomonadaceae bacterium]|nr:hypothetical protein [Pyrinomonadaceae bacterium]
MENDWEELATTTHQDHVIAHVIGTTALGYIVLGDAIHLLLDIGFIWKIYSDAEMGLLPHPVAVAELDVNEKLLDKIKTDIEVLLRDDLEEAPVIGLSPLTSRCVISEVQVFTRGDLRKVLLMGEAGSIEIQTSVTSETVRITECEAK